MYKLLFCFLFCASSSIAQQTVVVIPDSTEKPIKEEQKSNRKNSSRNENQKREQNFGIYFGGGPRKFNGMPDTKMSHYNSRYGVEGGLTYKRTSRDQVVRMTLNAGITYDYFDAEELSEKDNYRLWHKMYGIEILFRPEVRLFKTKRWSSHLGAGVNLDAFISYRVKYTKEYFDPYLFIDEGWQKDGKREEAYFGFNAGVTTDFSLSEKLKIGLDISLVSRLRIDFTSSSQYTGQNLRLSLVRVF